MHILCMRNQSLFPHAEGPTRKDIHFPRHGGNRLAPSPTGSRVGSVVASSRPCLSSPRPTLTLFRPKRTHTDTEMERDGLLPCPLRARVLCSFGLNALDFQSRVVSDMFSSLNLHHPPSCVPSLLLVRSPPLGPRQLPVYFTFSTLYCQHYLAS